MISEVTAFFTAQIPIINTDLSTDLNTIVAFNYAYSVDEILMNTFNSQSIALSWAGTTPINKLVDGTNFTNQHSFIVTISDKKAYDITQKLITLLDAGFIQNAIYYNIEVNRYYPQPAKDNSKPVIFMELNINE